jgi:Ca2+-dependent lipid-binding protein
LLEITGDAPTEVSSKKIDGNELKKAEEEARKAERESVPPTSVGWKQIGEWEEHDTLTADDELMDLTVPTLLDSYIPEVAYGDWYHTVGLHIGAGLVCFLLGWFNFSIATLFFIILPCAVYYRTSIKKYRSIVRDNIQMEFTAQRIENDYETMDWLNVFLDKYWIYLEPSVSQMVTEQANPMLASQDSIPAFVKSIWIDELTLGTKPLRIDLVKTLNIQEHDVVVMDWGFSYTPNDIVDNSAKQIKNHVNQRVVLKAKLFGITIPVILEDVAFKAVARVRLKMTSKFPHVESVSLTMLQPPQFDFVSKFFGETAFNWELLAIPGLYPLINEMIKKFAGPMLFDPFSFQLNIPQLLSGSNTSIGIIAIHVKSAKDLRAADRVIGNTIDPYITFCFHGQRKVYGQTKTLLDTLSPRWDETVYLLVGSFTEPVVMTLFDFNDDRKDKKMGELHLSMNAVSAKPIATNQVGQFVRSSKPCGQLLFDYEFYPTLEPTRLDDGSTEPPPDLNTGLTKIELTSIRNVENGGKPLCSYTELYFNDELIRATKVFKNNSNPTFSVPLETIVTDRRKAKVKVIVRDPKGKIIAASLQPLSNLVDHTEIDKPWIPFSKGEGEFKITAVWKSVDLPNVAGAGGYTEPIGVVRVLFNKAEDLRNIEKVGKVDPYARVLINNVQRARTAFIPDELDPVWDEAIWVSVTSPNQKLTIEVMDAQKDGDDRTLGSFNIKTSDIIERDDDDKYVEHIDSELRTGKLVHKKGPKGIVTYGLSFYPITPVKSLEDIEEELRIREKKEEVKEEEENDKAFKNTKKEEKDEDELGDTSKVEMSLAELITYHVGVLAYTIVAGEYSSVNSYIQIFFDSKGFPDYVSPPIRNKHVTTPSTGDVVIRELEWSICTIRLVKKKSADRGSEFIAESSIPTLSLLKNSYNQPNILTLSGMGLTKIKIQTRWIPIPVTAVPSSDLITNSGNLDLDILSAENLLSADSNGKSDPFVKLYINDKSESFYKTRTMKKTLNPQWNEKTSIEVKNRVNTVIKFKILDWDFGAGQDDLLGYAYLELAEIDPIQPSVYNIPVVGANGEDAGVLHVKTTFRPGYIINLKSLKTSVGDVGLKTIGTGLGAGLKGGKAIVGGGVGVVGKVRKGIFGGGKKDKHEEEEEDLT